MSIRLREDLRQRCLDLGFERVGFALAGPVEDGSRFLSWLAAGRHADLGYMEREPERRLDPRVVLPGCRTVLVATVGHWFPDPPTRAALPAQVARYARGRDYHRILPGMLKRVCRTLDELVPPTVEDASARRHRWYVDTGPVLERGWAREAGVGFVGKNACLIDRRAGSWSTLGVVLTTVAIPPDETVSEGCGTCVRCIDVCPTGAIVGPGQVDARLCISYWTIEHRGTIPESMRVALGTRVFGCDDCQDVCPWNRFARPSGIADHRPRELFADADLARLAALDHAAWDEATRGSAVRRAGYAGLLRNVAVALGNTGDERARPHLERLAGQPEELVREHARWGLARLDGAPAD